MMHMHHDSSPPLDAVTCACQALRKASRAVTRFYDEVMDGSAVSLTQFSMLRTIQRHAPVPLMRLAELLVMDRTTLYRALGPLERQGWITLAVGEGRAKVARLTPQGAEAIARSQDAWQAAQEQLIGRFGLKRWQALEGALADLVTLSQEHAA